MNGDSEVKAYDYGFIVQTQPRTRSQCNLIEESGSIKAGKIANFTVLNQDLMHEQISKIPEVQVVATIVDGNEVWPKKAK